MLENALTKFVAIIGNTSFAIWLGMSTTRIEWLFVIHLFGLVLLLGSTVIMSMRLLGLCMTYKPITELGRTLLPLTSIGLTLMILSGGLIFIGGAVSYFMGMWFKIKMIILLTAILFHFLVFRRVVLAKGDRASWALRGVAGIAALCLWFGVGWAGRSIAFF